MTPAASKSRFWLHILILVLTSLSLTACHTVQPQVSKTIKIGLPVLEQNGLIYIAEHEGFFRSNGLTVSIEPYDSGVTALNALLAGEVDMAVAAEFPVVRAVMDQHQVAVLASIDRFENDYIVARKDRGIAEISDLKGKRVGVALRSINEFFLARFMELNGLHPEDITQVNLRPSQFVEAISNGQVDALIAWQPYIYQIQNEMKDILTWPAQSSQSVYGLLVSRPEWLAQDPQVSIKFMASLLQSENYLANHPDEAMGIVQKQLGYTRDYVTQIWKDHAFILSLDSSLIVAMNDEARWLIYDGISTAEKTPDFNGTIYIDSLKAVKPEAVEITR